MKIGSNWIGFVKEKWTHVVMEENQGLHLVTHVVTIYGAKQLMCVGVCMRVCVIITFSAFR